VSIPIFRIFRNTNLLSLTRMGLGGFSSDKNHVTLIVNHLEIANLYWVLSVSISFHRWDPANDH